MVKLNGEEKELAGKNLLEYLKAAGFKPDQVVVERNLEIVPKEQLGCVTIQISERNAGKTAGSKSCSRGTWRSGIEHCSHACEKRDRETASGRF